MTTASWREQRRLILRAALKGIVGVPIGALLFGIFYFLNFASLGRDVPRAQDQVRSAFAAGILQDIDYLPRDVGRGWHQYNDCLILWQSIDQRASLRELAVSPLVQTPADQPNYCLALRKFAAAGAAPGKTFYHRYIHGHTMLVRYLLPVMGVERIRELYRNLLAVILICGIGVSMVGIQRGRRTPQNVVFLILFIAFARFFGLESFGQSLGHGPSDMVQLAYLLFLAVGASRGGIGKRTAVLSAAMFGGMVAIFEFLTGGIHLGLATVIGALPFALRSQDERPEVWLSSLMAFCASAVSCVALKYMLAAVVFGVEPIVGVLMHLQLYAGLDAGGVLQGRGLKETADRLITGVGALAPGMTLLAGLILLISVGAGAYGASRLLRSPHPRLRRRAAALLLSNAAIVTLLLLLSSHTITHSFFMERTLVWTIGSGFALFALASLDDRNSARSGASRASVDC